MNKRGSGVLAHIVSLPSPYGIGDLGPGAYKFVDFLAQTRQSYWQVLPLNPTDPQRDFSPYSSISSFALNPLLISPELLLEQEYIQKSELIELSDTNPHQVNYSRALSLKQTLIDSAFKTARIRGLGSDFSHFCDEHAEWLNDHALYTALTLEHNGRPWNQWPPQLRDRDKRAIEDVAIHLSIPILKEKFIQFLLLQQWIKLKEYCHSRGVQLIGDLPMFVSYESVDVWANRNSFKLNQQLQPFAFAGVPPDQFSIKGQLWHNPVYDWGKLAENGYYWWVQRFSRSFELFDIMRIDHFRGLVAFWEVPADKPDASEGSWVSVPVDDFFNTMFKHFFCFPVIAEDLGTITPDVRETMSRFGFPGTKVLLFAFEGNDPNHPYLPHMYERNCMACTGTHDTQTIRGWFEQDASEKERQCLFQYLGEEFSANEVNWKAIRLLMMSPADMVIFPMQDILGLGSAARMNSPGTNGNNWRWRFKEEMITEEICNRMEKLTTIYGRT